MTATIRRNWPRRALSGALAEVSNEMRTRRSPPCTNGRRTRGIGFRPPDSRSAAGTSRGFVFRCRELGLLQGMPRSVGRCGPGHRTTREGSNSWRRRGITSGGSAVRQVLSGIDRLALGVDSWGPLDHVFGPGPGPGLEPDHCYYTVNAHRMRVCGNSDLTVDPPPGPAIEVETVTSSSLDDGDLRRPPLGVPEVVGGGTRAAFRSYYLSRSATRPSTVRADRS